MIDGTEKHNRQSAFELQNSHVCEKRSKQMQYERVVRPRLISVLSDTLPYNPLPYLIQTSYSISDVLPISLTQRKFHFAMRVGER